MQNQAGKSQPHLQQEIIIPASNESILVCDKHLVVYFKESKSALLLYKKDHPKSQQFKIF